MMEIQKDIQELNHDLGERLAAFSSTLEAFELAAEHSHRGSGKQLDFFGMFIQCNITMKGLLSVYSELDTRISAIP